MTAVKTILTVGEAAAFLKKHPDTIRRWIRRKKLPARKLASGGSGIFAILRTDLLEAFVAGKVEEKVKAKRQKQKVERSTQVKLPLNLKWG